MGKDVIIACDFDSTERCLSFLDQFGAEKPFVMRKTQQRRGWMVWYVLRWKHNRCTRIAAPHF